MRGELSGLPRPAEDLPLAPSVAYHGRGWNGWGDFLGAETRSDVSV
jgi:hypothetical protein